MSSGHGQQRAFTQKLSKQHAADVRRNIAYSGKVNTNAYCSGWSGDVVEPLDYEDFLAQHHMLIERDPLSSILDFPVGDVEVALLERYIRTLEPVVPEEKLEDLTPHVQCCVRCFTSDWNIIKYLHRQYSSSVSAASTIKIFSLNRRQEFEIDFETSSVDIDSELSISSSTSTIGDCGGISTDTDNTLTPRNSWASFDLRNSIGEPLIPEILERISPEGIDQLNESRRQASEDRQECLFSVYNDYYKGENEEPIERRLVAEAPSEHLGHRVLVKCLQLKLEIEVEPIFATMALYDAKEKKKLSENFYFDMNSENVKRMLGGHIPFSDISTLSRSCIFNITHPSPDLFIVVRLEKVLQGDINECIEPYMKDDKVNRQKVKENAVIMCDRLGKYRQAFAWTAIYLMNVINGISTLERDKDTDSISTGSSSSNFSNTNSLERKISSSGLEQLRRRATDMGSLTRRGSLERKCSEKRRSWSPDHFSNGLDTFRPLTLTVTSFFKLESERLKDEDLYKFLQELKRPCQVMKKLKCIPGFLKLDISPCPPQQQQQQQQQQLQPQQDIKYCLNPELKKLKPYPDDNNELIDDKSRPIKELIEFPLRDILLPHYSYRNLLYVSPKELNFSNRTGSARNIAVKVQLMSGESEQNALCNIFGKSSCPEFTTEAFTSVTYHSKTPIFYDEIKMKLPATLGDQHHLLFTFYHISCQRKETQTTVDTPVGYTWLPLFKDNCLVTGEFCLPVMLEPPPLNYRYIPPEVCLPGTKWLDNHKGLFTVHLDAISSIHTQDKYIENFFKIYNQLEGDKITTNRSHGWETNVETELRNAMNELAFAKPEALVKHLCVVFDMLLKMMVQPPVVAGHLLSVAHTTFETICKLLHNICTSLPDLPMDQHGRLSILATYIQYQCTLPYTTTNIQKTPIIQQQQDIDLEVEHINTSPSAATSTNCYDKILHQELVLQWVVSSGAAKELAMSNAWFLFDIIVKSMVQHLHQEQLMNEPRRSRFPEQLTDDVTTLVHMATSEIIGHVILEPRLANQLNAALAFFLFDLVSIMDRGYVLNLVRAYCKQMSAKISSLPDALVSLVELKLDFLRIICSHEHYVALNLPFGTPYTVSSAPVSPNPSITSSTSQTSFLSGVTNADKGSQLTMGTYAELSIDYRQQHYLTALLLSDLTIVLEMQTQNNNNLHSKVISMIRNLLKCHDSDARLLRAPEFKMRVASLYIPLLQITMDALPLLYYWQQMENRTNSTIISTASSTSNSTTDESINQNVALAIAGKISYLPPANYSYGSGGGVGYGYGGYSSYDNKKYGLNAEQTRHLLICVLWILKNLNSNVLNQWLSELSTPRLVQFLQVLDVSITCFEYKGKKEIKRCNQQKFHKTTDIKSKLEDVILGHQGSARSEMMQRRKERIIPSLSSINNQSIQNSNTIGDTNTNTLMSQNSSTSSGFSGASGGGGNSNNEKLRWRKEQMIWRSSIDCTDRPRDQIEADAQLEGTLATEVTFIILDAVERVVAVVASAAAASVATTPTTVATSPTNVIGAIFKMVLHALARNQSTAVLPHMFATQRSLVYKFHSALFDEETEQCADLCLLLLKHCGSVIASVRTQAAASLYLLMRQTFEIGNNFARIKMQLTISLSSLVGTNTHFNEEYLKRSLKTILEYAERDVDLQDTTFPEQVHDLIFNLHMILSDTVKMKEFQEDPEMLLDLMYRIAKGYQNSPDLRLTWLASMAQKHMERNNHSEAGMCLVHSAALVAEYVAMLEPLSHLPAGAVSLETVSPNVLAESAVSDDVLSPPEQEGVCLGSHFTEAGLLGLLEHAASSFQQAAMYEPMNDIYKVLIPIAEHNRDFKKLANIHGKLHEAYTRIDQLQGKRVFGTYFRVGFYGDMFGDLDQQEFIYKEPTLTKLPEIFSRLEKLYAERFGAENVCIIKDSNTVDVRQLDPHKAYIQITYVEPYFEPYELRYRQTHFDRNFNIKRFVYSTPFTTSGRAHGELHEQYKRKTILTTAQHFPYVKTRIQVVERRQLTLTPIEVAIEDIQKKTAELVCATVQEPPDPKILQMVLQGCIGTTVNQGPMEMALVFLSPSSDAIAAKQQLTKHQNKLRLCFKDFAKRCQDALRKNKNLIACDQRDYQRELERNYRKFTERLQPLINHNNYIH